jgi:hypothetical protein
MVDALEALAGFRDGFYRCLTSRSDELFELADAVLCTEGSVKTLVELALAPEHRRGHGALYDGLNHGGLDVARFRRALSGLPLPRAADGRLVLAVDVSPWLRPDANTSPDRCFCHTYGRGKDEHRMIPGWPYSFIAALETGPTSWTAILDAVRLAPGADIAAVTVDQLRDVVERFVAAGHWQEGDPEILVVLDAGYEAPRIAHLLGNLPLQVLGRLRSDRVFRRATPPRVYDPKGGRPRKHGGEFVFGDSATWGDEDVVTSTQTRLYGTAVARAWDRLHPILTHRAAWAGYPGELPIIEGTVIRLEVDHLPSGGDPKPVWLWWSSRRHRRGRRPLLDVVPSKIRHRAHIPASEADPGLDRAAAPRPGGSGPLDLAGDRRPHPAAPGPATGHRPAPALGEATGSRPAHPGPRAARVSEPTREDPVASACAQTLPARPRATAGLEESPPRAPPRRRTGPGHRRGIPQTRPPQERHQTPPNRLNGKLSLDGFTHPWIAEPPSGQ